MSRDQASELVTTSPPSLETTADQSSADQTAMGNMVVSRIAGADDVTLPTYQQALAAILGPSIAMQIAPSDIPPEVNAVAKDTLDFAAKRAAELDAAPEKKTATSATETPAKSGTPAAGGKAADASDTIPAKIMQLRNEIDAYIVDKVANVLSQLPLGQAISQKFRAFDASHPGIVLEALVLAAVAATGRDLKIPTISRTFHLGDNLTVGAGVNLGSTRNLMLKSLNATIEYKSGGLDVKGSITRGDKGALSGSASVDYKVGGVDLTGSFTRNDKGQDSVLMKGDYKDGNFDGQGSFQRDFATHTNTYSTQFTEKDIDLLGWKIDEALASYKHTAPDGKPATDTLRAQLKWAMDGANITVSGQDTLSPMQLPKTNAGSGGKGTKKPTPQPTPGRVHNEQLTESVALPAMGDGYKLTLGATENFGPNHARDTANASLQLPEWHDVQVTVGQTLPFGSGTGGKAVTTVSAKYKGVTFTLTHGATTTPGNDTKFGSSGETATAQHGAWAIGISMPIKF